METHSATTKQGRYDCPACGKRVTHPVMKGTIFRPTYHCPHCGVRFAMISPNLVLVVIMVFYSEGTSLANVLWPHLPFWASHSLGFGLGILGLGCIEWAVKLFVDGPYRSMLNERSLTKG